MTKSSKTKAKGKTKAAARKPKTKPIEKVIPTHLPPDATIVMGLHDVIKVVKMLAKHDCLTKFSRKMKKEKAEVRIRAHTVNLVKDFVAENGLHKSAIGKHIVNARVKETLEKMTIRTATAVIPSAGDEGRDPHQCNF